MSNNQRTFHHPEYAKRKRKQFLIRISFFCAGILLLVGGFAGLTHWSKFSIDTVTVTGTALLSPDEIKSKTLDFISGNDLYIFAKKNALFYPKQALINFLLTQYPRIQTVTVSLSDYHTISIQLSERRPFALWCNVLPLVASTTPEQIVPQCYFLDKNGFVFSDAPDFSGDAYFKYYGLVPFASAIGSTYLSSTQKFNDLSAFATAVKDLNITPLYIIAEDQDNFEMHLYGGGKIIFDDTQPLSQTTNNLVLLLQTANLVPQKNGELLVEYIDLRYGNKLYYKVRQ